MNEELNFFVTIKKKYFPLGGGGVGLGGQGGCDRRIEVFGKIHNIFFFLGGGGRGGWVGGVGLVWGGGGSGWM